MDLTKIDKPFGELDEATQGALLLAHHRGEVIEAASAQNHFIWCDPVWSGLVTYRVQPKTVVIGEVVLSGIGPVYHSLHPMCAGGEYKISVTFPTRDGKHVPGVYTSPDGLQIKIEVTE